MSSRLSADNLDTMSVEELRELVKGKQETINSLLRENQDLNTKVRHAEDRGRALDGKVDALQKELKTKAAELARVANELLTAQKFAAGLYQNLTELSTKTTAKKKDIFTVVSLYHQALHEVAAITAWPKLSESDLLNAIFAEAKRHVFGPRPEKPQPVDPTEFIERSLQRIALGKRSISPLEIANIRSSIESLLVQLPRAGVVSGYHVDVVETVRADDIEFKVTITNPMMVESLRRALAK